MYILLQKEVTGNVFYLYWKLAEPIPDIVVWNEALFGISETAMSLFFVALSIQS
jgi:hypothetical protein